MEVNRLKAALHRQGILDKLGGHAVQEVRTTLPDSTRLGGKGFGLEEVAGGGEARDTIVRASALCTFWVWILHDKETKDTSLSVQALFTGAGGRFAKAPAEPDQFRIASSRTVCAH